MVVERDEGEGERDVVARRKPIKKRLHFFAPEKQIVRHDRTCVRARVCVRVCVRARVCMCVHVFVSARAFVGAV